MSDYAVRQLITGMLTDPNAHLMLDKIIEGFPADHYGTIPDGFSHSAWQLLEHLRIAQEDILDFSINPDYEARDWPDDYWPKDPKPQSKSDWKKSVSAFNQDLGRMVGMLEDKSNDLFKPFEHGDGQTLLREAILLIKHNSYHFGQLMLLQKYFEETCSERSEL